MNIQCIKPKGMKKKSNVMVTLFMVLCCTVLVGSLVGCRDASINDDAVDENGAMGSASLEAHLFDLAIANRFDYVPTFAEGEAPAESADYLYYAFILNLKEWKAGNTFLTADYVEKVITSHFEVDTVIHEPMRDWDFDGEKYTIARPSSYRTEPLYGVKEIKTYTENDRFIHDVTFEEYVFDEFAHGSIYDLIEINPEYTSSLSLPMQAVIAQYGNKITTGELAVWEAIREMIVAGETQDFEVSRTEHFKFYFDEQSEVIVFVSHEVID